MDSDENGTLTIMELYRFLIALVEEETKSIEKAEEEIKIENVRDIFKTLDKDGDRAVNFEEFFEAIKDRLNDDTFKAMLTKKTNISRQKSEQFSEQEIEDLFYQIDVDRSGHISKEEVLKACRRKRTSSRLGIDDVEEWLNKTDRDEDGNISLNEFKFAFLGTNMIDI
ncbi:caltractin isoform X2 [Eurytemora carolleeae]|nr:caltractin isoform X2 [Eurytemora carolleeae]|eukprot:XP_023332534.1 caltractin-like isoform X2 [Eurytemora affinis]